MRIKHWIVLTAMILLAAGMQPLLATGEGCRLMHATGDVTEGGCVRVTRDFMTFGPPAINVSLPTDESVVIDLCGHTLTNATTSTPVIAAFSGERVTILNGALVGGAFGVQTAFFMNHVEIDNVSMDSQSQAGVGIDDASTVTITDVDVNNSVGHGVTITDSSDVTIRGLNVGNTGATGLTASNFETATLDSINVNGVTDEGIVFFGSGAADDTFTITNSSVRDARAGLKVIDLDNWHALFFQSDLTTDAGLEIVDSSGGMTNGITISGAGADGISLTNSSDNTFHNTRINNPQGNGLSIDATSNRNTFVGVDVFGALLDGVLVSGQNNLFQRVASRDPGGCPIHTLNISIDNVFYVLMGAREAGPCPCGGSVPGPGMCEQGTNFFKEFLNN